ncbi:MAG TPA: hypothetical protein VHF89_08735 [Solirubrobacteraceae bacterium]|nr:hypothetical protein [Solirubrobacteraceae bacterium]
MEGSGFVVVEGRLTRRAARLLRRRGRLRVRVVARMGGSFRDTRSTFVTLRP